MIDKLRIIGILVLVLAVMSALFSGSYSLPQLSVAVVADKPWYTYRSEVGLNGFLSFDGQPFDGLAAVQVSDPNGRIVVVRTASVGGGSETAMEIPSVTPSNMYGDPTDSFAKGQFAYVKVSVRSSALDERSILLSVCAYDNDSSPILSVKTLRTTILPGANITFMPSFFIDTWVSAGRARFYAGVYSDLPSNGGYPYSAEKSATFAITSSFIAASSSTYKQASATASTGAFNLTFRLPPNAVAGTYVVNASAYAQGFVGYGNTTFDVVFQMLGDVNYDRKIDILDVVSITGIYGSSAGSPDWNPEMDIQPNGKIDISDLVTVTSKYGTSY